MTVKELIEHLKRFPSNLPVFAFTSQLDCYDKDCYLPIEKFELTESDKHNASMLGLKVGDKYLVTMADFNI